MEIYKEYKIVCSDDFKMEDLDFPSDCFINAVNGSHLSPSTALKVDQTYLYDVVSAFDIETSSVITDAGNVGIMYHWQWLIHKTIFIGRTWEQFDRFQRKLREILGLRFNVHLNVFVHNLGFEFQYLRSHLSVRPESIISRKNREVLKCSTEEGFILRDTYAISNKSLDDTVQDLFMDGISKLKTLDYSKVRTPETYISTEELEYCLMDVICVAKYVDSMIGEYKHYNNIPITFTDIARRHLRSALSNDYFELLRKDYVIRDFDEFLSLQNALHGGFVYSKTGYFENVTSMDIKSMYPSVVLTCKLPIGTSTYYDAEECNIPTQFLDDENKFCIVTAELIGVKPYNESFLVMSRNHIFNIDGVLEADNLYCEHNRVYSADRLVIVCTAEDLSIYKTYYNIDRVGILEMYAWDTDYIPLELAKYLINLFSKKESIPDGIEKRKVKVELNSLGFGVHATSPCRDGYAYSESKCWYSKSHDFNAEINRYNYPANKRGRVTHFAWGIAIPALARRRLFNVIDCMELDDIIYIDTDSIKFIGDYTELFEDYNNLVIESNAKVALERFLNVTKFSNIGTFVNEGTASRFKTLGPKKYIFELNNEITRHISGLPKTGAKLVDFSNFDESLILDSDVSGKTSSIYVDNCINASVVDYTGKRTTVYEPTSVFIYNEVYSMDTGVEGIIGGM